MTDFDQRSQSVMGPQTNIAVQVHSSPQPKPKFLVPYPRNEQFIGRGQDLADLNKAMENSKASDKRLITISGLGGIGKTQLAVEYAYQHVAEFPDGIYWVNAADTTLWQHELAEIATKIGLRSNAMLERQRQKELIIDLVSFLNSHTRSLMVFDNVEDLHDLQVPILGFIPIELRCNILATTRRQHRPDFLFEKIELDTLTETAALALLLRSPAHKPLLERPFTDPELVAARRVCRLLGYLPLAIILASTYIGKYSITLHGYLKRLEKEGALRTVDEFSTRITSKELKTFHNPGLEATFLSQLTAINNSNALLILQTVALLSESAHVPVARIALLSGIDRHANEGYPAPLEEALIALRDLSLAEELPDEKAIRIHALVRDFSRKLIPNINTLSKASGARLAKALWNCSRLHSEVSSRGIDAVLADIRSTLILIIRTETKLKLENLLRVLEFEAPLLRSWNSSQQPGYFLQQLRNRCFALNSFDLQVLAEKELASHKMSYLKQRLKSDTTSPLEVHTATGHLGPVNNVAITPDGRHAVSASDDGTLKVWELSSGEIVQTLTGHIRQVFDVAIASDSRIAVSASWDGTLRIWDINVGKEILILEGHAGRVNGVAVTPDRRFVISGSDDCTVKIWDLTTGKLTRTLEGHTGPIFGVTVSPDGNFCVSASDDGKLILWSINDGLIVRIFQGHDDAVNIGLITPDKRLLVSASDDRTVKIWNLETGLMIRALKGHTDWVHDIAFTPDSRLVISAGDDRVLKVWDLETGKLINTFNGHSGWVCGVAVTPNGKYAVSASSDGTLMVWEIISGKVVKTLQGRANMIHSLAMTSDGQTVVAATDDGIIRVYDVVSNQVMHTLEGHQRCVTSVAIMPNGNAAVSTSDDDTVKVWDLEAGTNLHTFEGHPNWIRHTAIAQDGRLAVSGGVDGIVRVYELAEGRTIHIIDAHQQSVNGVAISPDNKFFISASEDHSIKVWNLESGEPIRTLTGHTDDVNDVVITPNGQFIVSASGDHTVRIWNFYNGEIVQVLNGHTSEVVKVAVTSNGEVAISVSFSGIRIWNLITGGLLLSMETSASMWSCAATPDGRTIVLGDLMGNIHFIDWIQWTEE